MTKYVTKIFTILIALISLNCRAQNAGDVMLIPQVDNIEITGGVLQFSTLKTISVPKGWEYVASNFVNDIIESTNLSLSVSKKSGSINIVESKTSSGEEYTLEINKKGVVVSTATIDGANRALATLHQLLLTNDSSAELPLLVINDAPRFEYRGLMLDCSRHFWSVEQVQETIRQMAFFKINKLHLHLTDNNAWRLAMDQYPELVEKGTYYYDFPELSGKYYTKDDLKGLVQYALERGIEIIPEIDMPGHNTALLAAMPHLSCNGGEFEAYPEERALNQRKRGNENMVCVGNEQSIAFVEEVVELLVEIFPSQYIHLGGDEVPTNIWAKCDKCMELYKREGMTNLGQIQDYFTGQVAQIVRAKGKTMVGWDEINDRHVATPEDVVMVWRNEGTPFHKDALERGVPIIMCPQHGCYLDWGYAGNSTRKAYEWEPVYDDVTAEEAKLIKGAQACIWTERVPTQDRLEWMLYPRLSALSEVMWSEKEQKNWDDFYKRITAYYPVMEKMGINYYDDDAINMAEFEPQREKPALVRHAQIETNIPLNHPYHPEYAFDGMTNSFFWGGSVIGKGHYFTLILGEPTNVNEIKVITGDSKDYITKADLMVSSDGETFEKVAEFDELGEANATIGGKTIKVVKILVTQQHTCWPVIKEIIIK
ncbi:MAG: family 20 glycosylhydrolase [Rikenellaceae bacterium]